MCSRMSSVVNGPDSDIVELHRHVVKHALKRALFQRHAALAAPRKVRPAQLLVPSQQISVPSSDRLFRTLRSASQVLEPLQPTVEFITCRAGQQQERTKEVFAAEALEENEVRN